MAEPHPITTTEPREPSQALYESEIEANLAGIAHHVESPLGSVVTDLLSQEGVFVDRGALAVALENKGYSNDSTEVAKATLEQQRFIDAVEASPEGTPVLVMSHCSLWSGITGDSASTEVINRGKEKNQRPFLRIRGRNISGHEVWFYGGRQGESSIKSSEELEFFGQSQVITDNDLDKIDEIVKTGSWLGVHEGVQVVGKRAVNALLTAMIKHDFAPDEVGLDGKKQYKRALVYSPSTLAVSLLKEQGYDWAATEPTRDQSEAAELLDATFRQTVANYIVGMVSGKGSNIFYAPYLCIKADAWRYRGEDDIEEITQLALGFAKEDDTFVRLKEGVEMIDGDIEAFARDSVKSFVTNILNRR